MTKILIFGNYNEKYPRNILLEEYLHKIENINIIKINLANKKNAMKKLSTLLNKYDYVYIPYLGHKYVIIYKILFFWKKEKIIFDMFISLYNTMVEDRKLVNTSFNKTKYFLLDKISTLFSTKILIDTKEHKKYIVKKYKIPPKKVEVIYICANEQIYKPSNNEKIVEKNTLVFIGNFIPLQGIKNIILAMNYIPQIKLYIIGSGQEYKIIKKVIEKYNLKNIKLLGKKSPYDAYRYLIKSTLALGIFGNSLKTKLVIPNKVYEALASKKPVITLKTDAIKELDKHVEDKIILTQTNSPKEIAKVIKKYINNNKALKKFSEKGYQMYKNKCHKENISKIDKIIKGGEKNDPK